MNQQNNALSTFKRKQAFQNADPDPVSIQIFKKMKRKPRDILINKKNAQEK
jgi:hypothetical protein